MKIFNSIYFGKPSKAICKNCTYFRNDPSVIEDAYPGLTSMSSGYASVRDKDGLCDHHDLYLSARDTCPHFSLRVPELDQVG